MEKERIAAEKRGRQKLEREVSIWRDGGGSVVKLSYTLNTGFIIVFLNDYRNLTNNDGK